METAGKELFAAILCSQSLFARSHVPWDDLVVAGQQSVVTERVQLHDQRINIKPLSRHRYDHGPAPDI